MMHLMSCAQPAQRARVPATCAMLTLSEPCHFRARASLFCAASQGTQTRRRVPNHPRRCRVARTRLTKQETPPRISGTERRRQKDARSPRRRHFPRRRWSDLLTHTVRPAPPPTASPEKQNRLAFSSHIGPGLQKILALGQRSAGARMPAATLDARRRGHDQEGPGFCASAARRRAGRRLVC